MWSHTSITSLKFRWMYDKPLYLPRVWYKLHGLFPSNLRDFDEFTHDFFLQIYVWVWWMQRTHHKGGNIHRSCSLKMKQWQQHPPDCNRLCMGGIGENFPTWPLVKYTVWFLVLHFSSDKWLGHELKIDGTFLPHTGEDFWLLPAEEFSVCCNCEVFTDEFTFQLSEFGFKWPPLKGVPADVAHKDWLSFSCCCPWDDREVV